MLLALVLALLAPPAGPPAGPRSGSVELRGERFRELRQAPAEAPAPAPWAQWREVAVRPVDGGLSIRGRWQIRAIEGGWFSGQLFGSTPGLRVVDARYNGQPAALKVDQSGGTIAGRVQGSAEIVLELFVPGDPAQATVPLQLLPAVRGRIEAQAPAGLVPALKVDGAPALLVGGSAWSGGREVELSFETPPAPAAERPPVVVARVGIGLTVGDADLRGRARAVFEVRQGEVSAVELDAGSLGQDLEVTGPNVRGFTRAGERVRVELQAPVRDRVEVMLNWTTPVGRAAESRADLPRIVPAGVFHSEVALQLARDGEVEAVPEAPGWSLVASSALPGWAQGLVEGTPTTALRGGTGGSLSLLRFVPLEGPPMVVDVAAYTVATSREGRVLVRAHYEIRNERAARLRLTPPAGMKVIGVRVGGKTAAPARASDGAWIVPLLRSVETVGGLLSFPVEVILLGESSQWRRREARSLPLPTLDAPIAVSRLTLHLPPGYRSRMKAGEGDVVAAFTRGEGISYGLGFGEVGAAQADAIFQDAVQAWMRNDFGEAQKKLDDLRSMGAKNENIDRLQSNLDVVGGKSNVSQDMTLQRRIREQAKARAYADVQAQAELKKKAEEERARGDYEAAASSYSQALVVGDKLAQLEQEESVDQKTANKEIQAEIFAVQSVSKRKRRWGGRGKKAASKSSSNMVFEFADDNVDGLTLTPDGAVLAGPPEKPQEPPPDRDGDALMDVMDEDVPIAEPPPLPAQAVPTPGDLPAPDVSTTPAGKDIPPEEVDGKLDEGAAPVTGVKFGAVITKTPTGGVASVETPPPPAPPPVITRDSTAVVDVTPTVTRDTAGITLSGSTGAESRFEDSEDPLEARPSRMRVLARTPGVARGRLRRAGRYRNAEAPKPAAPPTDDKPADTPVGMPTPVVHASALSVVVPAVGEAVRYQRLLLPAGAAYAVEISAKEPLLAKE